MMIKKYDDDDYGDNDDISDNDMTEWPCTPIPPCKGNHMHNLSCSISAAEFA